MSEGFSDFFATALNILPGATRENSTWAMGAWARGLDGGSDSNKEDIWPRWYAADMGENNATYSTMNEFDSIHEVGAVWAEMLYHTLWNLVGKHGKSDAAMPGEMEDGVPADGKFLALKLVTDAMAL